MKHIRLFLFAILAIVCMGCEKKHQDPIVTVTHEVISNDTIAFIAKSDMPVIMFYWHVYCNNAKDQQSKAAKSLREYNVNGEWDFYTSDTIYVCAQYGQTYNVTLCYYESADTKHRRFVDSEAVTLP